jgi:hypothetical protein
MRLTPIVLMASVIALAVPAFAAAHYEHAPCSEGNTLLAAPHVDFWNPKETGCVGVIVVPTGGVCQGFIDEHFAGLHVLVSAGCQTGVILELP